MTITQAKQVITVLMAAFPGMSFSTATREVYEKSIHDLEYEVVDAAVRRLVLAAESWPTIADLRREVLNIKYGEARQGLDAWGDVVSELRRVGSAGRPEFSDPIVADLVRAIGWNALCASKENDGYLRTKFATTYEKTVAGMRRDALHTTNARPSLPPARSGANRPIPAPFDATMKRIGGDRG